MGEREAKAGCILCGARFGFAPHAYHGHWVDAWGVSICHACLGANSEGVALGRYPRLAAHLEARGIEIRLNEKGWLPIPR